MSNVDGKMIFLVMKNTRKIGAVPCNKQIEHLNSCTVPPSPQGSLRAGAGPGGLLPHLRHHPHPPPGDHLLELQTKVKRRFSKKFTITENGPTRPTPISHLLTVG